MRLNFLMVGQFLLEGVGLTLLTTLPLQAKLDT